MSKIKAIKLRKVSKRYTRQWILKNVNFTFADNHVYGVKGLNGSGKSTLLKMISGYLSPSAGNIIYESEGKEISREESYQHVSIWAPYVSLIKELTIREMVDHYLIHKPLHKSLSIDKFYTIMNLTVDPSAKIKSLSSGQEQRLGLSLSVMAASDVLLLDEPSSYLDSQSKEWLYQLLEDYKSERIVIIASNDSDDLELCKEELSISDYK